MEFLRGRGLDGGSLFRVHHSFHHLPPVSRVLCEFLSNGLRSAKVQALQGEVDKMLEKGTLEMVDGDRSGIL